MGAAVGEEKNPAEEAEKETDLAEVGGKFPAGQLGGSEKTQMPVHRKEPTSDGGSAAISMDLTENTHLKAVAEEEDNSEKVQLQEKIVKKRKRSELQEIKQEKLVSDAEKTHLTVGAQQPHLPCGAEQEHLLAVAEDDSEKVQPQEKKVKKRKRSDAEKSQVIVDKADRDGRR